MMRLLETLCFFFLAVSLNKAQTGQGGCEITSITSPLASNLLIKWTSFPGATLYYLDVRVQNSTTISPVVLQCAADTTEKLVQGLRPGTQYLVIFKVLQFQNVLCISSKMALTVPAASQLTYARARSSTSATFQWTSVAGADSYVLVVDGTFHTEHHELTFSSLSGEMLGLQPAKTYSCYVYSSNSAGLGAKSNVKTINTLVLPPDVVTLTPISRSAVRVTWTSVPSVVLYQVSLTEKNRTGVAPLAWNTSALALNIPNLKPCTTYTVGVSSLNMFLQPGEPSIANYTTNPIASVTSITVDYSCSNAMATVSWDSVPGAMSYHAVATARSGTSLSCNSTGTSCQISALGCGEQYTVHIFSVADCESISNISHTFETAPCPPKNPEIYHDCLSNVIVFSWNTTNNTAYYIAMSVDADGVTSECLTMYNTCYFTQTECGRRYNFTVSSVYAGTDGCRSGSTAPVTVSTAPCLPQSVTTSAMDCLSDTLIASWNPAPGALNYLVQARGNRDDFYNCTSTGTSCTMTNVKCGQSLSVWITASNNECVTDRMLAEVAETVPCVPEDVSILDTCGSSSITLSWLTSNNAFLYTAKAILPDNSVHSCYSMDTQCEIKGLQCGQTYQAFVMSTNFICNSSDSQHIFAHTAPCAPVSVQTEMDCQLNTATVHWQGQQAGGSYTAVMVDGVGGMLNCSTNSNNCSVPNLQCGQTYNITVLQNDTVCNSLPSTSVMMESVPCAPQQVVGMVNCSTGVMSVGWSSSAGGVNYTAAVWSGAGARVYCNTSDTHCNVGQLDCGKAYSVEVLASRGTCQSPHSQLVTVEQVPCVPTGVSVSRACGTGSVGVSWASSAGAHNYTAIAVDVQGHKTQCTSVGTSCSIANLTCGQMYSVGVLASNNNCSSQISQTVSLYTDPCTPTGVSGLVNCSSSTASLLWASSPNALYYIGRLQSSGDVQTCNVSTAGCQISGLLCGQHYNFTVSASDGSCASAPTAPIQLDTAPCATQNVSTNLACDSNSLTVSWSPAAMSLNYVAIAVWKGGSALSCSSQSTSCSLQGLQCGQQYNVTVTASNGNCSGPASPVTTVQTAPCVPQNVTGHATCGSGSLVASWVAASGASSYTATLSASGRVPQVIVISDLSYMFSGLQCASQYSITVASQNGICNSTSSPVITVSTGPCDPQNVTALLQCSSNTATVTWSASTGASGYAVLAQTDGGQTLAASCSTSSTSCQLTSLTCGKTFNITVLAGDATCNTSSQPSATVVTAPCHPSILNTSVDCATNTALVSWTPASNAIRYLLNGTSTNGHEVSCISTSSSCNLTGLECGQTYSVFATARGQQCDSPPSASVNILTVPCPPSMVNAHYDCSNNTALIGWDDNDGSVSFVAILQGGGYSQSCSTTGHNCSVTNLSCGHSYNITVKALSNHCNSSGSQPTAIQTVPCATQNVSASWQCVNSSAVVAWTPSTGVSWYGVTALGSDGDVNQCNSTTSTCQLNQMHCGQTYNITVTPYTNTCMGVPSTAFSFNTGPCAPKDLSLILVCFGNLVVASWTPVTGADSYTVTATAVDGHKHFCSTNSNSCTFTDLHCGETYSVTVVSEKQGCFSKPSAAETVKTGPCNTTMVAFTGNCSSSGSISWASAAGASVYIARVMAGNGHVTFCSTNSTSCAVSLDCGQNYSAVVVASSGVCNSSESSSLQFHSAPCLPQDVTAALDCAANQLTVQWQGTSTFDLYTAVATSSSGQQASCNVSSASSCSITGLQYSQTYNISVVSSSSNCSSIRASGGQIQSAPCKPVNVSVDLQCDSNSAVVHWGSDKTAQSYNVTALDSLGGNVTCSSISTSCVLTGLSCGRKYNVTVVSQNSQCVSKISSAVELSTVPCATQNVSASWQCVNSSAVVAWTPSTGVSWYGVTALGSDGDVNQCNSTTSTCQLNQMQCGQTYNITVTPYTNTCMGVPSTAFSFNTGPCAPKDLSVNLVCFGNLVVASWTPVTGADSYTVTATAVDGHKHFCSTNSNSCTFTDLHCGETYSVTVVSEKQGCFSKPSAAETVKTAPCAPTELNLTSTCSSNTTSVSWTPSSGTVAYYIVSAIPSSGLTLTCNTSSTSCDISGLACGQTYNFSVTAYEGGCAGGRSLTHTHTTAPCVPQNVQPQLLSCQSGDLSIAWQPSTGALSYRAEAVTLPGHLLSCESDGTSCVIPALSCGMSYEVSVVGVGESCNSSHSITRLTQGAPCPPGLVTAVVNCTTNTASVSWNTLGVVGAAYTATAISNTVPPTEVQCNNTGSSCTLTGLQCGTQYNVTVTATKDNCTSLPSAVYSFFTAPCVPNLDGITLDCGSGSALAVWSAGLGGADLYSVSAVDGQGGQLGCNSTQAHSCTVSGLRCGQTYTFSMTVTRGQCTSMTGNTLQTHTAACPAQAIQTSIGCHNSTASVSWSPGDGALSYLATLQSSDGHTYTCNSTTTSCDISNLPCGQSYSVTVAAKSQNCSCTNSTGSPVKTVPCAPSSISALLNCETDAAVVMWGASAGSLGYIVSAVASQGSFAGCSSNNSSTTCTLSNLKCGAAYTVSVQALGASCNSSSASMSGPLITEPCIPQNITINYDTFFGILFWDSTAGADSFTALAKTRQGLNDTCPVTTDTYCTLSDMQCGQIYNVTVTAHNSACNGTGTATSLPYSLNTEPCPPQNLQGGTNCSTHVTTISWDASLVAVGYVVFLDAWNGESLVYSTQQTSYSIPGLRCGMTYTTYVQALGQVYNSSYSETVNLLTGPCSPDSADVFVQVDCATNLALLSWAYSNGADNYTAIVRGSGSYLTSCSTQENHCNVSVQCGQTYSLTLTYTNKQCQISTITNTTFQSSPCVPTGLVVVQASGCGSAGAVLNWNAAAGADGYMVTGWNRDGHTLSLSTNLTTISLPNLHCSQEYNFTISASNQHCNSTPSLPTQLQTGPCSAGTISAVLNCSSNVAVVSWQPSNSSALYTATLQGSSGPPLSCVGVGSQCNISGLACGKNYSVTVTVSRDQCNSTSALPSGLQTGPCVPVNISAVSDCANNSAVVAWDQSSGATSYHVYATSSNGNVSCQSTTPTCILTNLTCGSIYSVQVVAEGSCTKVPSQPVALNTGPCQPENVSVEVQCVNATAVLSWAAQTGAVKYFATAQSDSATPLFCQTMDTSCTMQGLQCGSRYNFSVVASNGVCNSSYSKMLTGGGAPCPPASLRVVPSVLLGQGQLLRAYWSTVNCPYSLYLLEISGSIKGNAQSLIQMTSYWTNRTYFETPFTCSSTYHASVRAQNSAGTSAPSAVISGTSVPCPPLAVNFTGSNSSAVVSWDASLYATVYHVYQTTGNNRTQLCNTSGLSCSVNNVNSNLIVVTAGNSAGESAGTSVL